MAFELTREQSAAVTSRGSGLLVSAAAGSGKTRVLVERLLRRVEEGTGIDRFLVITYTKAAAAELRGRIVAQLSERLMRRPDDAYLRSQTTLVYKAQISTIDAFCAQFLREEGYRVDLDPDFRLCDENEALLLMTDALNDVLDGRYEQVDSDPDFAFLVDTMSAGRDDTRLMEIVLDIRGRVQSHPDPAAWLDEQERTFALEGVTDAAQTMWGELLLSGVRRQAGYWARRMEEAARLCQGDGKLAKAYGPGLEAAAERLDALSRVREGDWDAAARAVEAVAFPRLGSTRGCEDPEARDRIKLLWSACKDRHKRMRGLFQDGSAALLEDMRAVYPAIRGLFALVRDFERAYTQLKSRRGVLDFSDLEHLTAQLLWEDGRPSQLALRWGERFDEVMVDEYQDTNAVQNAIFDALTDGGKNLFMVGDVKQSIYRFRLADPAIFLSKYRTYRPWEEAEEGEPRRVLLSRNFRSRREVLEGCNYVFRSVMSQEFGELDYTRDEELIPGGSFPESAGDYRVELDVLDADLDTGGEEEKPSRDLLEARFAARRIRALLDEGFPVSDGAGGTRRVQPADIVVLLRSPGPVLRHYAGALGELDIPWSCDSGEDFFAATEIQVALSLLRIIDNPRQDVPLIAALRSAVYGFSADRLSEIRAGSAGGDFYTALTQDAGEDARSFLAELTQLRRRAGDERCERLVWRIYDQTNLLGIFGALPEGQKRRENLLRLARLAGEFEGAGHKGLFGFLRYLQRLEDSGGQVLLNATAGGGVRLMSIHRSKGLEFPVVLLAGLARQLNRTDAARPILFHTKLGVGPKRLDLGRMVEYPTLARLAVAGQMDRELAAEELRLLYVAMTRAKEKLILSVALSYGRRELEKLLPMAGAPAEPQALLDQSSPGHWLLLCAMARREAGALREGAFVPAAQVEQGPEWDIRWVDGGALASPPPRISQAREEAPAREGADLKARFAWKYPYTGDVELPSKLTATQLKGRLLDEEASQQAPQPPRPVRFERPRFAVEKLGLTPAQRGTALHLVMQYIDFSKCGSVRAVTQEIARLVERKFLTPEQGKAAPPKKIAAFFASALGREVLAAPRLRREFKFSILVPARRYYEKAGQEERILLQGVVDAYFEDGNGELTVIDFKTDHVFGEKVERRAMDYAPQLAAYAGALEEITGKTVRRKVLWFFSEGRGVEV